MSERGASLSQVPVDDRGLLLGDGLFETLLWSGDRLVLGPEHAARMVRGAAILGLTAPAEADFLALAEWAARDAGLAGRRAAVRVTLTAGSGGRGLGRPTPPTPRLFATAAPADRPEHPLTLAISGVRRNAGSPTSRLKTLAYLDNVLAREEARRLGAEEAVMLSADGAVACAGVGNLFWIADSVLFTPSPDCGCLEGIFRQVVLRAAGDLGIEAREVSMGPDALMAADGVFLTNSLVGVRAVSGLGDRGYPPHPMIETLARATARFA